MFEKIKKFFKKIFQRPILLEENTTENKPNIDINKSKFNDDIKVKTDIYFLQKMYEEEKITENDLQIYQIKELINLYKKQLQNQVK